MKLGIVLSGGGVRGFAHIGLLKLLEEMDIEVKAYAGASSGSIIGALAAEGYGADEILEICKSQQIFSLIKPQWPSLGLTTLDKMADFINEYIPHNNFSELQHPLFISISNITAAQSEIIHEGEIAKVVQASCSIPIIFRPVQLSNDFYLDGGLMNNLPAQALEKDMDKIIAVDLVPGNPISAENIASIYKLAIRTFELAISSNASEGKKMCDLVLTPKVRDVNPLLVNKSTMQSIFESGYEEAKAHQKEIEDLIK